MSSYKSGKPIVIMTIVMAILASLAFALALPIQFLLYLLSYRDSEEITWRYNLSIDYYEQIILKNEKVTAVYQGVKYENLDNGFREYYSESHKTPVDESSSSSSSMYFASESDSFFVCVSDGSYTYKAMYGKNVQSFTLYCVAVSYSKFADVNFNEQKYSNKKSVIYQYNSVAHFNNLIEFLYNPNN